MKAMRSHKSTPFTPPAFSAMLLALTAALCLIPVPAMAAVTSAAETYEQVRINGNTLYLLNPEEAATESVASKYVASEDVRTEELTANTAAPTNNETTIWKFFYEKGFSSEGIAGIMGNLMAESDFLPNNLENRSNTKAGITDAEFTAKVDSGEITREEFISSSIYGLYNSTVGDVSYCTYGYGLAQWTYYSRKAALYDYWKSYGSASIADLNMQLNFIYKEMSASLKGKMTSAADVTQATVDFHNIYEGSSDDATRIAGRVANAQTIYDTYKDGPVVLTSQSTSKYRVEGQTATFSVTAKGAGLTYQWQYMTPTSSAWKNCSSAVRGYRSASMKVNATGSKNGYKYRCVVTDIFGNQVRSKSATLTVFYIKTQPVSVTKTVGSIAYFKVTAVSSKTLTYRWQYRKPGSTVWTNCSSAVSGYHSASMHVTAKTSKNGWSYRCLVTDTAGHTLTTSAAKLTVK